MNLKRITRFLDKMSHRFYYFCKQAGSRYSGEFQCVRVPMSDPRIDELTKKYSPSGWYMFQSYAYKPSVEEEIFKIKMHFRAWEQTVIVEDPETAQKNGRLA